MEKYNEIPPKSNKFKNKLVKTIFWFLGNGFEACVKYDSKLKSEVSEWPDGTTINLIVEPSGPYLTLRKEGQELKYIGAQKDDQGDMVIYFKNLEAALLMLTGRIGIAQAYGQKRIIIKGDIAFAMSVVRCMNIVEAYLFPKVITKKILKRLPRKEVSTFRIYLETLF